MRGWKMLAVAAFCGVLSWNLAASAQTAPPPTKLAVININKVFSSLDAKKTGDQDLEMLNKKLNDERQAKADELKKIQEELKAYAPESDIYRETQDKLFRKAMDLENFSKYMEQKLLMEERLRTVAIYKQINKAIEELSKARGIALVLVADEADVAGARSQAELLSRIAVRKVIYADESLDITKVVIEKMNTEAKAAPK